MGDVKKLASPGSVTTLWIHECNRVFADRLINTEDRTWFLDLMKKQIDEVTPPSSSLSRLLARCPNLPLFPSLSVPSL